MTETVKTRCPFCEGAGHFNEHEECWECEGSGKLEVMS
jgi:DnaJ-class molecular chaperone